MGQTSLFALPIHPVNELLHLKSCKTRVDGMASIGFRYAAHAHISVADRLEHLKPVALRNLIKCREIVIKLPDEFFRLQALCQLREALEIGKQNRCCIVEAGCNPVAALKFLGDRLRKHVTE